MIKPTMYMGQAQEPVVKPFDPKEHRKEIYDKIFKGKLEGKE